ncbi:MAG: DUF2023 family protein [Rikenellaceae bacterium]
MTTLAKQENAREMKVFLNHIYELKKGIRKMVLHTMPRKFEEFALQRLQSQNIPYHIQPINNGNINLFFGKSECIKAVEAMINRPLNELNPEQDFILGAILGYDISGQCERYLERKVKDCI